MNGILQINNLAESPDLLNILSESVYMPTIEKLQLRAKKYMSNPQINIWSYYNSNKACGLIIVETIDRIATIHEIAVLKEKRKNGIGSKLIDYCKNNLNVDIIIAETDDDAVSFYKKYGFEIKSLGDKYNTGIIRYECILNYR